MDDDDREHAPVGDTEPTGVPGLVQDFMNGLEQQLSGLSPEAIQMIAQSVYHQDGQLPNPKANAAEALAGYVRDHRGTVDTGESSRPTASASDGTTKRITTATSGGGLQSGASHPTQLTSKKTQAAHAFRNHR